MIEFKALPTSVLRVVLVGAALIPLLCAWGCRQGGEAQGRPRVLLVGLDGADLRWVERLHREGRLPHLGGLMERGVRGPLATVHYWSPVIWTSIATGVRPERHGIGAFLVDPPSAHPQGADAPPPDAASDAAPVAEGAKPQALTDASRPNSVLNRLRPAFWNVLSHYGRSVGVLAWWASYPAEPVDGFVVSPYLFFNVPDKKGRAQINVRWQEGDPRRTFPPALAQELAPLLPGAHPVSPDDLAGVAGTPRQTPYTPWIVARDTAFLDVALHMLEAHPVDVLAPFFQGIDVASHDFTGYVFGRNVNARREPRVPPEAVAAARARVEAMYQHVDAMLGRLLERVPPDTDVIVVSDHGWEYDGTSHWNLNPGLFLAAGRSFRSGVRVEGVSVVDIAPILYAVLDLPVADALDGDVPAGVLRPEREARVRRVDDYPIPPHSLPAGTGAEALEDEAYIEMLKGLGYVE